MPNQFHRLKAIQSAKALAGPAYKATAFMFMLTLALLARVETVSAQDAMAPTSPKQLQALEIADNIYVLHGIAGFPDPQNRGLIANLGFIVTTAGVVLIDTGGSDAHAEILLSAVAGVTDQPVVAAFNTHIHGDHWLGNDVVKQRFNDVQIYAHPKKLESATDAVGQQWVELLDGLTEGQIEGTVPWPAQRAVAANETISVGETTFTIAHSGHAHTDNDIMVHVQPGNVVFLGDNAFNQRMGRMDDGNFQGNIDALDAAIAIDADVYVPGHGPTTSDISSARDYRDYLRLLYDETAKYYEEGLSDFEIKDLIIDKFERWSSWPGFELQLGRHVSLVYLEIEENAF